MKLLKYCFLLFTCSITSIAFSQDISGEWNGFITQGPGGLADKYYISIYIKQDGEKITGKSKVAMLSNNKVNGTMSFSGTFKDGELVYQETGIIEDNMFDGGEWCLKRVKMTFAINKSGMCLEGTWGGQTGSGDTCAPGKVTVCQLIPVAH